MMNDEHTDLLSTMYVFQQNGYLCDATVISTEGNKFPAHAAVLAASSSRLVEELSECERGNYTIILPLTSKETQLFIKYAYTGDKNILGDSLYNIGSVCDFSYDKCHANRTISKLHEFAEKGLFCNMFFHTMMGDGQPCHSFIIAAMYDVLSLHIMNGSFVNVTISSRYDSNYGRSESMHGNYSLDSYGVTNTHPSSPNYSENRDETSKEDCDISGHSLSQDDSKPYKCDTCGKGFAKKCYLQCHEKRHSGNKPHICFTCGKAFFQAAHLKRHSVSHIEGKPFVCLACNKRFKWEASLQTHECIDTPKPHMCPTCGKGFTSVAPLKLHQRFHKDSKDYSCGICGKRFVETGGLKRHELTHTGVKPYCCEICHKQFTQQCHLKRHELTHTGAKPFICDTCQTEFTRAEHFKKHICTGVKRVTPHVNNDDVKPFSCQTCSKRFSQRRYLKRHEKIHSDLKQYTCTICEKEFTRSDHLKSHEESHKC